MLSVGRKNKSELRRWLRSLPFAIRVDLVKRDNETGYSLDKFLQEIRKIDYEVNLATLGRNKFRYVRKAKNDFERIFGIVSVEGKQKDKIARDIHFHILFYVPGYLSRQITEVEARLAKAFIEYRYDAKIEAIEDLSSSVYYNTKENKESDPLELIYFTHQSA